MVKRQADKQLTDRNCNDEDLDDTPATGGLATASPQAISKRQIRALPKKTGASASMATSKFGAAPSFPSAGKPASSLFGQPASQSSNPTPSSNLFGGTSSFGASSKSTAFGTTPSAVSTNPATSTEPQNTQALTTYYASLRGLNLCVTKAFDGLIKKDAFADLSSAFDHVKQKYSEHRLKIEAELEQSQSSSSSSMNDKAKTFTPVEPSVKSLLSFATNGATKPSNNGSLFSASAGFGATTSPFAVSTTDTQKSSPASLSPESPTITKPESPPSSDPASSRSSSTANGSTAPGAKACSRPGAFTMAAPMRPSPLRYESQDAPAGSPPLESSENTGKSASSLAPIIERSKPESSLSSTATTANEKAKLTEGNSVGTSPGLFSFSDSKSKTTSLFGATGTSGTGPSLFGATGTSGTGPSSFGSSSTPKPFSFGSSTTSSTQNSAAKPPSVGFGFGSGGTGSASVFGGFGPPKSAVVQSTPPKNGFNPVGFSFGGSPPTSAVSPTKEAEKVTFGFGSTTTKNSDSTVNNGNDKHNIGVSDNLTEQEGESEALDSTSSGSKVMESIKGEEEEETLFETTGRVYALLDKKQDDGKIAKKWIGWAICTVKLNKHKQTKRCRILARSQVNQGILINFFVNSNLKPMNRENSVEVLGFNPEGTHLQAYRIRPSSTQVVEDFVTAIQDAVQSSPKT
ncbi:hypothetical protein MJO28_000533 [Puccinia striiformis f. sp. tritici]|uniref:RanBD1 domain-containing protein n=4 Tax=Puccinia striiformis TaxID=27350 RepID=A0A0L0W5M9_9BASI|nr:hypothetical protein Pst134EA_000708 [Puccinia striiformis f. sp. tritici]KAI9601814.1 hypothetical protein KEM48_001100 [Puccinia striiformis f. sp. tritici PST-130]KNF06806.1 hypothetical protein PSTG_00121 [Puccinia striiformis f. sp. tritici PST-78]POW05520.1 hypothetical protein PSHT_10788 [Puccinia striiformis]KAH9466854.1 hypothetical protein Pst134EB_001906 [Puccinia striiformis f. sp. tritici]KAH9473626.1 hypothetical protein Pst134EA_000708 [Puccinia striiformis f. sp. tritici]